MGKATTETAQLILVVAIALASLVFIVYALNESWKVGCKRAQMDEFNKIWKELRYWESRENVTTPGYNVIPDFNVKPCVKKITYDPDNKQLVVEWTDSTEEMPALGEWFMCPLIPESTYDVKVSLRRVEFPDWEKCV